MRLATLFPAATAAALRLRGARWKRFEAGDVRLRVYEAGPPDGEPWLALHGLGSTAISWWFLLPQLRRGCRLLMPELSGLGGSRVPGGALDVREATGVLAALLEARTAGRPATVVGLSLGGWVAIRLALARPDLFGRLAVINAAGFRDQSWGPVLDLVTIETRADIARLVEALFARPPWGIRLARPLFAAAYRSPGVVRVLGRLGPEDLYSEQELTRLEQPAAVIWGERDGLFPLEVGRRIAAALPRARFYPIPDAAHAANWDAPDAVRKALEDFRRRSSRV